MRTNKNKNVDNDDIVVEEEEGFADFEECENWVLHLITRKDAKPILCTYGLCTLGKDLDTWDLCLLLS